MRKIIVAFADTHSGHLLGLLSPNTKIHEQDERGKVKEAKVKLTATQKWLWKMYQKDFTDVVKFAAGDPIVLITLGDLCNGDKYPDQLVSTRRSDQITMAVENLRMWLELPNLEKLRIVMGTSAHGFGRAGVRQPEGG